MLISESLIRKLIKQALLEQMRRPESHKGDPNKYGEFVFPEDWPNSPATRKIIPKVMPDARQTGMLNLPDPREHLYHLLQQGKSLKQIFPNASEEELKSKIKDLYAYIKKNKLKQVKSEKEFGGGYGRFEGDAIRLSFAKELFKVHTKMLKRKKLNYKALLKEYIEFLKRKGPSDESYESVFKELIDKFKGDDYYFKKMFIAASQLDNYVDGKKSSLVNEYSQTFKEIYEVRYLEGTDDVLGAQDIPKHVYKLIKTSFPSYMYSNKTFENMDELFGNWIISKTLTDYDKSENIQMGSGSLQESFYNAAKTMRKDAEESRAGNVKDVGLGLKKLTTAQIKSDKSNWFAVHYVGAFVGKGAITTEEYFGKLVSFINEYGGAGGTSKDEFAGVPYPKSAQKLNDKIARGFAGNGLHKMKKIAMVLNGTITAIYKDDVHSDTFAGAKSGRGAGGFDEEEGFIRLPGGEWGHETKTHQENFLDKDKPLLDLDDAAEEIAAASTYPGTRGYYECFIDDWYAEGIACDWDGLVETLDLEALQDSNKMLQNIKNFLLAVKQKNLKIYDDNFKEISFEDLTSHMKKILEKVNQYFSK